MTALISLLTLRVAECLSRSEMDEVTEPWRASISEILSTAGWEPDEKSPSEPPLNNNSSMSCPVPDLHPRLPSQHPDPVVEAVGERSHQPRAAELSGVFVEDHLRPSHSQREQSEFTRLKASAFMQLDLDLPAGALWREGGRSREIVVSSIV
eukprot:3568032-Rhodomonas_salina.2